MRFIAVNRFYRPDQSATSQLLGDLAETLAAQGHGVIVVTSRLGYEGGNYLAKAETIAGVHVKRVTTTGFGRSNLVGRAVDYLTFYFAAAWTIWRHGRRGDVLIVKTDPPLMCIPGGLVARFRGMRTVNWCQDLFPEIAEALGLKWARGPIGALCRWARNRALKRASFNAVLHAAVCEKLVAQGVPKEQLRVLPNWADRGVAPVPKDQNSLRKAWGLGPETFVIGYSGNLGRAHLPDEVVRLVKCTSDIPNLVWLFIGGGDGLVRVKEGVGDIPNVMFKPYQPRESLRESLSAPDMHLVSLDPACEGYIIPSKFAGARAAGRPILFLGRRDGALAQEIKYDDVSAVLDVTCEREWRSEIMARVSRSVASGQDVSKERDLRGSSQRLAINAWTSALLSQEVRA